MDSTVLQGEITDTTGVTEAVAGADAVLSGLGAVRGGPTNLMETAARQIVSALQQQDVRRLIWASGAGVPAPQDQPTLVNKLIGVVLKLTAGSVLEDSLAGVMIIKTSDLALGIIRQWMRRVTRAQAQAPP